MSKQREALLLALKAIGDGGHVEDMMAAEKAIEKALAERELVLDDRASNQACHVAWKQCADTIDKFDNDPYGAFTMGFHAGIRASINATHPPAKPAAYLDLSNDIAYSMRELSNEDAYDTDAMVPLYLSPQNRKLEQEPVAWRIADERDWEYRTEPPLETDIQWSARYGRKYEPLYTSPPTRKPLTDEEINSLRHIIDWTAEWSYGEFARAIERAHGIGELSRGAMANSARTSSSPLSDERIDEIIASNVAITDRNLHGAVYMAIRQVEEEHGIEE